jgi:hypothetical protein
MPDIGEITVIASNLRSRARRAAPEAARGRAALTISAVALAAAGLAACSSSSAPTAGSSSPAASPADPASSPASSPAASSPAAASGPDVCSVLTSAQVASFTRDEVEQVTPGQVGANSACTYVLSNSAIQVQVAPTGSSAAYDGFSGQVYSGANPAGSAVSVPGLGQQAIASSVGVAVQSAKHAYLVLNAHGQLPSQNAIDFSLAKALVSALG